MEITLGSNVSLQDLLGGLAERAKRDEAERKAMADQASRPLDVQARVLLDRFPDIVGPCPFQPGELVSLRPGDRKLRKIPVAVVTRRLEPPKHGNPGDLSYEAPNMAIALIMENGALGEIAVESFRFEKYRGEIAPADSVTAQEAAAAVAASTR